MARASLFRHGHCECCHEGAAPALPVPVLVSRLMALHVRQLERQLLLRGHTPQPGLAPARLDGLTLPLGVLDREEAGS